MWWFADVGRVGYNASAMCPEICMLGINVETQSDAH